MPYTIADCLEFLMFDVEAAADNKETSERYRACATARLTEDGRPLTDEEVELSEFRADMYNSFSETRLAEAAAYAERLEESELYDLRLDPGTLWTLATGNAAELAALREHKNEEVRTAAAEAWMRKLAF